MIPKLPSQVTLVAASKTRSSEEMQAIAKKSIDHFGENYVQEAEIKSYPENSVLHLIGHLQSNKVKKAVQLFDWIQSVDSEKLAKLLSKEAQKQEKVLDVLIEVNSANEEQKHGIPPNEVQALAKIIIKLPNLRLRGLMTMGPSYGDPTSAFKTTSALYQILSKLFTSVDTLSMGMSDSYEQAIELGSTMVRLGNKLFGPRKHLK